MKIYRINTVDFNNLKDNDIIMIETGTEYEYMFYFFQFEEETNSFKKIEYKE